MGEDERRGEEKGRGKLNSETLLDVPKLMCNWSVAEQWPIEKGQCYLPCTSYFTK